MERRTLSSRTTLVSYRSDDLLVGYDCDCVSMRLVSERKGHVAAVHSSGVDADYYRYTEQQQTLVDRVFFHALSCSVRPRYAVSVSWRVSLSDNSPISLCATMELLVKNSPVRSWVCPVAYPQDGRTDRQTAFGLNCDEAHNYCNRTKANRVVRVAFLQCTASST